MKTYHISIAKIAVAFLFMSISTLAFSQRPNIWKGGTPGMENDWNCHKNWSNYSVPDEFSNVIIPDVSTSSLASPVIYSGVVEINSLSIASTALLSINEEARLVVFGKALGPLTDNILLEGSMLILDELDEDGYRLSGIVKN